jgi:2-polyprenyl-3-methyl-5-hydroxy-6-metoxy-1,4-benzoquinol methylase
MARYKFIAKMLAGRRNVLEIGCGDAFNAPIVMQSVEKLTVTDFDPLFIEDALKNRRAPYLYDAAVLDIVRDEIKGTFDAVYSLDVLEHIPASDEDAVLTKVAKALTHDGVAIIGMPSLESQLYASPASKEGHINCKTAPDLKALMEKYFHTVFIFSMNDEVVHTGYHKMAHYLLALCCHKRG